MGLFLKWLTIFFLSLIYFSFNLFILNMKLKSEEAAVIWSFRCRSKQCVMEHGISYLIKSFSSDKNELVPFSLHSEAADRDRPRPLEAAGRAKNRLFSLVEEAEWVVTGDADLKIPK